MANLSPKIQRGVGIGTALMVLATAAWLVITALEDSIIYFYSPTDLLAKPVEDGRIRIGGLVAEGSFTQNGEDNRFTITDTNQSVAIAFTGILPDLFREGQGIVAEGVYDGQVFTADTILAKHDETYMPSEVADALKAQGVWKPAETNGSGGERPATQFPEQESTEAQSLEKNARGGSPPSGSEHPEGAPQGQN